MRAPVLAAAGLALLAATASCGYSVGFQTVAPGIETVAVRVAGNDTFRQRLEQDLTRAIARQLSEYSGYRHARATQADAILEVTIVAIRNSTLVYGVQEPVREGALDAIAKIRLIERRSGEVLVDTRRRDIAEYRVLIGEDESSARRELVSDLGRTIVLALEGDF